MRSAGEKTSGNEPETIGLRSSRRFSIIGESTLFGDTRINPNAHRELPV